MVDDRGGEGYKALRCGFNVAFAAGEKALAEGVEVSVGDAWLVLEGLNEFGERRRVGEGAHAVGEGKEGGGGGLDMDGGEEGGRGGGWGQGGTRREREGGSCVWIAKTGEMRFVLLQRPSASVCKRVKHSCTHTRTHKYLFKSF